jgi:DNA-binding beta-propeller fold protein YncE
MRTTLAIALGLILQNTACANPPVTVDLPGAPFGVVASHDGNEVFVALLGQSAGVAVLQRDAGQYQLKRVVPFRPGGTGVAITHDGKLLIVAAGPHVLVLDTAKMISGDGDSIVGTFTDGVGPACIYVNVTHDDKTLFVSNEGGGSITVIDLDRARTTGYDAKAIIGNIPVGEAPIALTFSPDDHWLYTTSEGPRPEWGWPSTETPEGPNGAASGEKVAPGAVQVIDVVKARSDPAHAVVAKAPAGGSPVRMTISPDGKAIFVTARGNNTLLEFDTAKLISDPDHARLTSVPVGSSPVPVALIQDGKTLVVGNSNRFAADSDKPQTLSVIDVSKMTVIGSIPAGAFPREMCLTADGRTLFVSNFGSNSLEIIDAQNPPVESK